MPSSNAGCSYRTVLLGYSLMYSGNCDYCRETTALPSTDTEMVARAPINSHLDRPNFRDRRLMDPPSLCCAVFEFELTFHLIRGIQPELKAI